MRFCGFGRRCSKEPRTVATGRGEGKTSIVAGSKRHRERRPSVWLRRELFSPFPTWTGTDVEDETGEAIAEPIVDEGGTAQ